jgi:hypothetical protein
MDLVGSFGLTHIVPGMSNPRILPR